MKGDEITSVEEFIALMLGEGNRVIDHEGREITDIKHVASEQTSYTIIAKSGASMSFNRKNAERNPELYKGYIHEYQLLPMTKEEKAQYRAFKEEQINKQAQDADQRLFELCEEGVFEKPYGAIKSVAPELARILKMVGQEDSIQQALRECIKQHFSTSIKPSDVTKHITNAKNATEVFLRKLQKNLLLNAHGMQSFEDFYAGFFQLKNSPKKEAHQLVIEAYNERHCWDSLGDLNPSQDDEGRTHYYGEQMIERTLREVEKLFHVLEVAQNNSTHKEHTPNSGKRKEQHVYDFIDALCGAYKHITCENWLYHRENQYTYAEMRPELVPFIQCVLKSLGIHRKKRVIEEHIQAAFPIDEFLQEKPKKTHIC